MILPGATIGLLGGGQLGRMFTIAARTMGYEVMVLDPDPESPAAVFATEHICGPYTDTDALARLAEECAAVTTEFENVPASSLHSIAQHIPVRPSAAAIHIARDRILEKETISNIGLDTVDYHVIQSESDLDLALQQIPLPAILKTATLGYDGKGQTTLRADATDLPDAFKKASEFAWAEVGAAPSILEGFVPFECEISIIGARGATGEVQLFDPAENVHRNGILKTSTTPANVPKETIAKASKVATTLLESLNYVGVIGVEFFVLKNGDVLVNEFAPRVHNSGHWTSNACAVSQFEQHIRAVAGWPLGDPSRHSNAVMENLIGDEANAWSALAGQAQTGVHLYGKHEARPGRKMGHVTKISARE